MSTEPSERGPGWLEPPERTGAPDAGNDAVRRRRLVVLGIAAASVAAFLGLLAALPRSSGTGNAGPEAIDGSQVLRPLATAADPATGERTAPFEGFAVSVETQPPGALVLVGGVPRGEAPVLAGVDCEPGAVVEIRAEKAGLKPARATTRCRSDTLVKLVVRLRR